MTWPRLVLLGDSILDNGPYTFPAPDTTAHLVRILTPGWIVERVAQDGAIMRHLQSQLAMLGGGVEVAVLSIGGNDLSPFIPLISRPAAPAAEVLAELLAIADGFSLLYEVAARSLAERDMADQEGFKEIAAAFRAIAKVEVQHEKRYRRLLENVEKKKVFKKDKPSSWKCRNCGHIHEGNEAPEVCPACLHKQAHFELAAENY